VFLIVIVRSALSTRDTTAAARALDYSLFFYFSVFIRLHANIYHMPRDPESQPTLSSFIVLKEAPVLSASLWAIVFWVVTSLAVLEISGISHPVLAGFRLLRAGNQESGETRSERPQIDGQRTR
jgi:hypothetical protein